MKFPPPGTDWLAYLSGVRAKYQRWRWWGRNVLAALIVVLVCVCQDRFTFMGAMVPVLVFSYIGWIILHMQPELIEQRLQIVLRYGSLSQVGFQDFTGAYGPMLLGRVEGFSVKLSTAIIRRGRSYQILQQGHIYADGSGLSAAEYQRLTKLSHYTSVEFTETGFRFAPPETAQLLYDRMKHLTAILQREGIAPLKVDWNEHELKAAVW